MISDAVRARQAELLERREPFVTATVVKVTRPTSAHAGNVALVRGDGSLEGFVGGVCAATSVRLYALQALEAGEPLLLRILPDPEVGDHEDVPITEGQEIAREPGAVTVRNPCLSGGAIEVFLEPSLPAPQLVVAGESPIAEKLVELGPLAGFEITRGVPSGGELGLVSAAHGRNELEALSAAVAAQLPYIGLVASPKRGRAILDELSEMGVDVGRVESPAGLDLNAKTPGEVAVSIFARVIEVYRLGDHRQLGGSEADRGGAGAAFEAAPATLAVAHVSGANGAAPTPSGATATAVGIRTAVDPICSMTVIIDEATPRSERDGETFYFCCEGCRRSFEARAA